MNESSFTYNIIYKLNFRFYEEIFYSVHRGGKSSLASILLFFIALLPVKSWAETYNGESGLVLTYYIANDEVTITGMTTAPSDGKMVIPGEIEGKPVTTIATQAFSYKSKITSVEIPASVKEILDYAFTGCNNLSQVSFAEGSQLTDIDEYAFIGTKIKEVTIPEKVTYIGFYAFGDYGDGLSTITVLSETPSLVSYASFGESLADDFTIIVPAGCAEVYKNDKSWTQFAKYIKEAEPSAIKAINAPSGTSAKHAAIYTLDGKLVSKDGNTQALAKGIYVQNGKKMVIGK